LSISAKNQLLCILGTKSNERDVNITRIRIILVLSMQNNYSAQNCSIPLTQTKPDIRKLASKKRNFQKNLYPFDTKGRLATVFFIIHMQRTVEGDNDK